MAKKKTFEAILEHRKTGDRKKITVTSFGKKDALNQAHLKAKPHHKVNELYRKFPNTPAATAAARP